LTALELILARPAQPIDLLRIQDNDVHANDVDDCSRDHWCANLASGGFGTEVTVETSEGLKSLLGGLAYVITGIAKLGRIDPIEARITGPGLTGVEVAGAERDSSAFAWQGGFSALGIGNGRQAGGGQALCPDALIDDGLLDVTIVPDLAGEVAATLGTMVTDGKHAALDRVATRVQLPWVEIETTQPLTLNLDGEPVESRRFRVDCVPARLRMHLSPDCPLLRRAATVAA
jgi:lipid kinase YegS